MSFPRVPRVARVAAALTLSLVATMTGLVVTTSSAAAGTTTRPFGVAEPGAPDDLSGVQTLTTQLGRAPAVVAWYVAWSLNSDFPAAGAAQVAATGARPAITWEPWDPSAGVDQPAYRLSAIAAGSFDAYITRWAKQIKSYKRMVTLRVGHEMNGSWYPWAEQVNGNQPGDYVRAFRHIRDVFAAQRVGNVTWDWSPNVSYPGSTPLASLYPGDAYVDEVGLDGYNWSTLQAGSQWTSFWDVFRGSVGEVGALTTRPVVIAETGCPEVGGDKAAWITDMFSTLAAHPEITGLTWFDFAKETNWRIDSSAASLDAFRAGLAGYR